jgi:hypothetical protein
MQGLVCRTPSPRSSPNVGVRATRCQSRLASYRETVQVALVHLDATDRPERVSPRRLAIQFGTFYPAPRSHS